MLLTAVLISLSSCQKNKEIKDKSAPNNNIQENESLVIAENTKKIKIETFYSDTTGWGYDIFVEGKKYIHQPHIPSVNGIRGFNSEQDAIKVANLMANKIENKVIPPSVSRHELDSLKIVIND